MKKIISILLSLVMIITSFTTLMITTTAEEATEAPAPGTDAYVQALVQEGYTAISNFSEITDYSAKYYLTADVTIPNDNATAHLIKNGAFTGVLDGNGHTVYNSKYGFFSSLKGTMKNLTFSKFTSAEKLEVFTVEMGDKTTALISSIGDGAVVENVVSNRTFAEDISDYYGAIVREVPAGATVTFKNVTNNSSIAFPYAAFNIKIGGFIGIAQANSIIYFENCVNNGNVKGSQAGGFIAVLMEGNTISFKNCTNNGTIQGSIGNSPNGEAARGVAGGFIGSRNNCYKREASINISFENCTNAGDVLRWEGAYSPCTKTDYKVAQGGFIGNLGEGGNDNNPLTLSFKNCNVSTCYIGAGTNWQDKVDGSGAVTTDYTQGYVGAIIGWLGTTNMTDNITIQNVTVANVMIESADPAYASLFLNTDTGARKTVVLKDCIASVCDGATTAATGNVKFVNEGSSTNITMNKAQKSAVKDGKMALRFLGGVENLQYTSLGFIVKKSVAENDTYYFIFDRKVYKEVNNGTDALTKADFNEYYISAAILNDVSATENATYEVTPYAIDLEGNAVVGATKFVMLTNGELS